MNKMSELSTMVDQVMNQLDADDTPEVISITVASVAVEWALDDEEYEILWNAVRMRY